MTLRAGLLMATWLHATLSGRTGPDDMVEAVTDGGPRHEVHGPDPAAGPQPLLFLPGQLPRGTTDRVGLAVPEPGDPVGLAGPPRFNEAAVAAGAAVVVGGPDGAVGIVPEACHDRVVWHLHESVAPPLLDPGESDRQLRHTVQVVLAELVDLDIAAWSPDAVDLILDTGPAALPRLPAPLAGPRLAMLDRAWRNLRIAMTARRSEGAAVSAAQMSLRRHSLDRLSAAARRALAAAASDSLVGP